MCDHAHTAAVAFDERRPVLEHVTCLECLTRWKTYGATWMVPVTKREGVEVVESGSDRERQVS